MKTNTLRAKLLNCFFAFTLVFGLCIPSIGSYAYAEPTAETPAGDVAAHVEGTTSQGENQSNGNGTGNSTGDTGGTNILGDGVQDEARVNDTDGNNTNNNGTETEEATTQAEEVVPMAADSTVGGLTISGGVVGIDFTHGTNLVVVKTSTPLTLKGTFTGSVQVQANTHAHLVLNGVTITGNNTSSPINLIAPSQAHITLVDGTTNTLNANRQGCAALHCGYGSTLYIDDQLVNFDNAGEMTAAKHVDVKNGVVDNDGYVTDVVTGHKTQVNQGDVLTTVTSGNPGKLIAYGGSSSAGIGSGPNEVAGTLIFDGGDIWSYSLGGHSKNPGSNTSGASSADYGVTNATGVNENYSSGTGIGAGAGPSAGGSEMIFNAATIHAYGSYHGAGIGAAWSSNGAATALQEGATSSAPDALKKNCGNITINGGYLLSQGYAHGNAFGGACGTNLTKETIRITGGTLLPYSYYSTESSKNKYDIGGQDGHVVISGGSIRLSGPDSLTPLQRQAVKFQSDDSNKAFSDDALTQEVVPITVNMAAETGATDYKITDWGLYIDGAKYKYGAPASFDKGQLYLWLPPSANKSVVSVELKYKNESTGQIVDVEPLYRDPNNASDTNVRRYVAFDLPTELFVGAEYGEAVLPEGITLPGDLLVDGKVPEKVQTIKKQYDGLPLTTADISKSGNEIKFMEGNQQRVLNDPSKIEYKFQVVDQENKTLGAEQSSGQEMPTNTGLMAFSMTSSQYATGDWAASYLGHRSRGWCEITPVPAVLTMEFAPEWGYLADNGTWKQITEDSTESGVAGNRLKLQFNIRSANTTATTCAAPTGSFQVSIDGKKVGQPIPIPVKPDGSDNAAFADSSYSTVSWSKIPVESETGTMEDRNGIKVTYYFDPTNNDALLKALEDASKGGKHTVNIEYIADKNYVVGEDNKYNKDEDDTFIVPVSPETNVKTDTGTDIPDVPTSPEDPDNPNNPLNPSDNNISFIHKSVTLRYSDYVNKTFGLAFSSTSSMPMNCTTSNGAVAELVKDENDNVLGADGKVNLKVNSCGTTRIIMEQSANALYTGTKIILDVSIVPDPAIKPFVQIRVVTNNLTHPGMPAAPGDEIEYLVTGLNTTPGSSWQAAHLLDTMDSRLTLKEDSVKLASNYSTPNLSGNESHDYTLGTEAFYNGFDWSSLTYTDLAKGQYDFDKNANKVSKGVGSVYGGQSTTLRFVATLQSGTADRPQNPSDPEDIKNEPEGTGGYGKAEIDLKPGEDLPDTTPLTPGKDIVVVGEPSAPDKPTDPGDNPGGDEPNPVPPLPIIPKDPILPGSDPTDPDNPDDPDKADPDIYVTKTAKNLTHPQGNKALVGDTIEYSITVENKGKDTCYYWPVIKDTLPLGLKPVAGSFELTKVDGTTIAVSDSCYQTSTHTISLYVDDLYGNEKTTLSFKCTVTPEATDIANTAQVIGTTPSDKWKGEHPDPIVEPDDDPETSYIKFNANGGEGAPVGIEGQTSSSITAPFPTTEPKREGYEFVGWNTQANGCGLGITSYPSKFLSKPGSIYYYAQWKKSTGDDPTQEPGDPTPEDPTQFSYILFAANGGTNAPEGIKGEPNSAITDEFPKAIPTAPEGYEFVGWFTAKTDGNKVEGYPSEFLATTDADNTTKPTTTYYYAHWQKIEDPTNTTPPAGGDPDPINPLEFTYIKFDANGGKFVTPVTAQAEGDTTTPTWSTDGLTGSPNGNISEDQKKTFPSREYGPVERKGYTFTGWNTKADGTGKEVTAYGDTLPASGTTYYYAQWVKDPVPTWPPTPGQPFSPDPKIPASEYPWDDPDNPFDWDKYLEDTPEIDTPEPVDVGKVMPADPGKDDLRITLSAKNETRMDGYTYVGDEVTYTILIENLSSPEKSWLDVIARADIPEGLKFIPGSVYLTAANGEVIHVDDSVYNDLTRILALNAGDLAGGQTAKVVFKAEVTVEALNKDIGMTSYAYATLPSKFDVNDESYVKPELGSAFVPTEGWEAFAETHVNVFNPEKVYPSEKVSEKTPPLGTPEQQAKAAKLAKTSDFMGFAAAGVGAIAIIAAIILILARKRIQKNK